MGRGPDLLARALAPELSNLWGQPVTVENHPGMGATAAPALVAKFPADGYTLLLNTSSQAYSAVLSKSLPYDPLNDFIPTASLTNQPYLLVAGKPAGVTTVRELIAAARAKPGQLKFASTGVGGFGMAYGSRRARRPEWWINLQRISRAHSPNRTCVSGSRRTEQLR